MAKEVLELINLRKQFGGVVALRGARLSVRAGEIHGLVGENGAGKSTLINIATGLFPPDSGELRLAGTARQFASPRDAAAAGIHVVHQEAELFAQLSLAENMLLGEGLVRGPGGLVNWPATYRAAETRIAALGERMNVRQDAAGLSVAQRTMAEIAAAVAEKPKVLFLDEPTASLTAREIANLFARIRALRDQGTAIVYVSHRLEEVLALCDRVTVMRDGETVATHPAAELSMDSMVALMVGREIARESRATAAPPGPVRLRVCNASGAQGAFQNISIEARAGEIVGLYGFVGAGRSEFAQALFGMQPFAGGKIEIDGLAYTPKSPQTALRAGLAYLPEDRLVQGVFRTHSLRSNASVSVLRRLSRWGWVRNRQERDLAARIIAEMQVRAASMEQPIGTLSGGNQQKVVFGRWQAAAPKVLILDEPTRGVDVGAKAEIHRLIRQLAAAGTAIVLISSELPEITALSDRVVTLCEGRITGSFVPAQDGEATIAAAAVPRESAVRTPGGTRSTSLARLLAARELVLLAVILLLGGAMALLRPDTFATAENFWGILTRAALPAILAQGAMLVICAGGIDISVGSMVGLIAAIAGTLSVQGVPPLVCLGAAMTLGAGLGMLNGGIALLARIHPIIVTLAGISVYRGLMRLYTGGSEVINMPEGYRALADGLLLGIPRICFYVIAVAIAAHVLLHYTLAGRRVLALGNSESAARLIGLSKTRLTLFVFGVSGGLAGLAAVLHAAYFGKVQANTGEGYELQAIAAAVIGGTNILGGRGSAAGALLGAFLVALMYNSLVLLEVSSYWRDLPVGLLILLAVIADVAVQRLRKAPQ